MSYLARGALIEYKSDFFGPIPNVVIFQFNPDSLTRNINIPQRPTGKSGRELDQAGEPPTEKITLTAHFSAADRLGANLPIARNFGVGPQLAALEKMVFPASALVSALGEIVDVIGSAIFEADKEAALPIPREKYPRILFIWGATRVLPIIIDSMSIVEQKFDHNLNPVQAEVSLGFSVISSGACLGDKIANGALKYTNIIKEVHAAANLGESAARAAELIPF